MIDQPLSLAIRTLDLADANLLAALCVAEPGVWQSPTEVADHCALNGATAQRLAKLHRLEFLEARRPPWGTDTLYAASPLGRRVNVLIDDSRPVTDAWTRAHLAGLRQRGHTAAHAAAVASCLWEAGLDSGALAWWWRRARSELDDRSPREALHADQPRVLALARSDADAVVAETRLIANEQQDAGTLTGMGR